MKRIHEIMPSRYHLNHVRSPDLRPRCWILRVRIHFRNRGRSPRSQMLSQSHGPTRRSETRAGNPSQSLRSGSALTAWDSLSDCSEPEGLRFLAGWSLSESSSEWGLRGRRGLPASLPDLFWFSSESLSEEAPFFRRSPSSESLLLWLLRGCLAKRSARYTPGSGGHLTSRGCAFKREGQNILDLIGVCTMIFLWCTFFGK